MPGGGNAVERHGQDRDGRGLREQEESDPGQRWELRRWPRHRRIAGLFLNFNQLN